MIKTIVKYISIPVSLFFTYSLNNYLKYSENKLDENFKKTLIEIIINQRM
jgi:hypothetical protein